jgi:hypothetical protein
LCVTLLALAGGVARPQELKLLRLIGRDTAFTVQTESGPLVITRRKTPYSVDKGALQPLVPLPGVHPVTEIEVLQALNDPSTMVIDMRDEEGPPLLTIPNRTCTTFRIPRSRIALRNWGACVTIRPVLTAPKPSRSSPSALAQCAFKARPTSTAWCKSGFRRTRYPITAEA